MIHKDVLLPQSKWLHKSSARKKAYNFPVKFLFSEIFSVLACFLIGRAVLFDQIAPFGMALYAVFLLKKKGGLASFLAVTAGTITSGFGFGTIRSIAVMILFSLLWTYLAKKTGRRSVFLAAFSFMICLLLLNVAFTFIKGFLLYELLIGIFESITGFVMVYVFSRCADVLWDNRRRRVLSGEELICLSIFLSLLVIGFWDITIFDFSLRNILTVFLILLFSYIGGAGVGAAIGITTGFMMSLSHVPDPALMGNLAICGLMAGTFKELGRLGSSISFFLANVLMTYYINRSTYTILPFGEIAGAVLMVLMLPGKTLDYLKSFLNSGLLRSHDQQTYGQRVQELIVGRLNEFAEVFHHLSKVFGRISERTSSSHKEELSALFEKVAVQTCEGCPLYGSCWERGFYHTYAHMLEMLAKCEEKGHIEEKDIPRRMKRFCLKVNELVKDINAIYQAYCDNLKWNQKLADCRQLVAEQLEGVSHVVTELAAELDMDIRFRTGLEDAIRLELDKAGIHVGDILVLEKPGGKTQVNIYKPACGGNRECLKKVEAIVSRVLGKSMSRQHKDCTRADKSSCTLHLSETRQFEIVTGIARKARQESAASGDSYSFTAIKDGKYMLALSDGMGFGPRAAEESSAVISLMENFLEAGFDKSITIKTINSILMLRSREEMFATADLCVMDLVEGTAEFIKIGGVPSYIRRQDKVEIIRQPALPIGILEDVEAENISVPIQDEDMIILMTDGILDAFAVVGDREEELAKFIATLDTINPQEMADLIMQEALLHTGGKAKDDMTVMAGRVWKPI